jgi:hypothetical protein
MMVLLMVAGGRGRQIIFVKTAYTLLRERTLAAWFLIANVDKIASYIGIRAFTSSVIMRHVRENVRTQRNPKLL